MPPSAKPNYARFFLFLFLQAALFLTSACGAAQPSAGSNTAPAETASPSPAASETAPAHTPPSPAETREEPLPEAEPTAVAGPVEAAAPDSAAIKILAVYEDGLAEGWSNWSWDTSLDLASAAPVWRGAAAMSAAIEKPWAAVYLHVDPFFYTDGYSAVRFWIHGGSTGGQEIAFKVIDGDGGNWESLASVNPQANSWTEVTVPLADLGNPQHISGLVWQDNAGSPQAAFAIDQVELIGQAGPAAELPPVRGPDMKVDLRAGRRPISPYIYGINFGGEALAAELHLPVRRWGGNSTTRYNWKLDVHNTGADWFFENIAEENPAPENLPDGSAVDRIIEQDRRTGTESIITIPLIGWTPKRRVTEHPFDCGFKVSKYGQQQYTDNWDPDCGNGVKPNGQVLTGNDPRDTSEPVTPEFVEEWLAHLTGKYGLAADGGVQFYSLDNEPMLWHHTHRDVHPEPVTYNELRDRTYAYAAAVKKIDPGAQTLGPVLWGWCAYFYSAADDCKPGLDYFTHAGAGLVEWYLRQMRAYEEEHGQRILDYLDLHIYPQGQGVYGGLGGPATQELRLRSTRALWDPNYRDESWIDQPIYLIPRMREWVDQNYPGTKLAITEYSWGAADSLNGALAQADILGIFGREGLDLAAYWADPGPEEPVTYAFRMYRNYDGQGSAFGETSVQAASADPDRLAVYAAQREADGALTIMVINKTRQAQEARIAVAGLPEAAAAEVYRYSAEDLTAILRQADLETAADGLSAVFPASSITLLVIPAR